ncbi:MAG: HEAT repeat domain-containing protein [Planctomycetota bacterium]|nr:HEAT repeat domain-containing protein [Planctomycetota bacterium]
MANIITNTITNTFNREVDLTIRSTTYRLKYCLFALLGCAMTGCLDGPLYGLKRANPYYQSQWRKDTEKGPTFTQRTEEMRLLKSQLATMPPEEQAKFTKTASDVYRYETSPEMRREAVMALANSPTPEADATLMKACSDRSDKVRIAACKALKSRQSDDAAKMLSTVAQTDESMSVKLAAIESLGAYRNESAKTMLRQSLDEKSPAMQYQATVALREMTGRDFEGNVESWKQFLDAGGGPESGEQVRQASLPERMMESIPFIR